jgi:hypothetical protein
MWLPQIVKKYIRHCTINVKEHNAKVSHHDMADPQVMDGGDRLQIYRVAAISMQQICI